MPSQTKTDIDVKPSSEISVLPQDSVSYIEIGEDVEGQRLDNYLLRVAKGVPKSHLYRVIRAGEVRVNRGRVKADTRLLLGDIVRVPPMRVSQKAAYTPMAAPLADGMVPVLFEDRDLLIVDKPCGLAAHGGSGIAYGLIERLRASRPDCAFLELAHRLDRETSGAIIVAKTRKALVRLHDMMREGSVAKHYRTLVKGEWLNDRQHVKLPLFKYLLPNGERRVRVDSDVGVSAHTIYTLLARYKEVSYLDVELKTGRTHQIRVHSTALGFPLIGDDKYGDFDFNKACSKGHLGVPFKRMFLHAYELTFVHPVTGESVHVVAPLPHDCQELLNTLEPQKK